MKRVLLALVMTAALAIGVHTPPADADGPNFTVRFLAYPTVGSDGRGNCAFVVRVRAQEFGKHGVYEMRVRGQLYRDNYVAGAPFLAQQSTDWIRSPEFPDDERNFYFDVTLRFDYFAGGESYIYVKGVGTRHWPHVNFSQQVRLPQTYGCVGDDLGGTVDS